jgi:hypothetical protein
MFKKFRWKILNVDTYENSFMMRVYNDFADNTFLIHVDYNQKIVDIAFAKGKSSEFYGVNSLQYKMPKNLKNFIYRKIIFGGFFTDMIAKHYPRLIKEEYREQEKMRLEKELV